MLGYILPLTQLSRIYTSQKMFQHLRSQMVMSLSKNFLSISLLEIFYITLLHIINFCHLQVYNFSVNVKYIYICVGKSSVRMYGTGHVPS